MNCVDLLVFDLDGTLVTSGADIAASVNHALSMLGRPTREYQDIMNFIGDGVHRLIEKSLGPHCSAEFAEALDIFSSHYDEHMLDTTVLYPSVQEVLRHFENKSKVIITNKRFRYSTKMVEALHIREYFAEIIGADTMPYIKPDSRILEPVLARYNTTPARAAVVGDGVNDVLLAKNAGVVSCAFLNGLTSRETLLALKPDYAFEDLSELMHLFC